MIGIKGNGGISTINTNILAIGSQHMEIAPQSHIAFCGGNVLSFRNFLPQSILNAILSMKANFG